MITITIEDGYYALRSPKDFKLINALKETIPMQDRRWSPEAKAWMIDPSAIAHMIRAIESAGYAVPEIPHISTQAIAAAIQKQFTVEYVGLCKERDGGTVSALGSVKGYWSIEFPESVLRDWFENREHVNRGEGEKQTLYQVLCVFESATPEEIKKAYWRLARTWHPDVCGEDDAAEKFRELKDAFDILRDDQKRARYNAGLYFQGESERLKMIDYESRHSRIPARYFQKSYRSPLRCGLITAEGIQRLNRFQVSKILVWDDITDDRGRVMSASWNKATESIDIKWI